VNPVSVAAVEDRVLAFSVRMQKSLQSLARKNQQNPHISTFAKIGFFFHI
jgi:hypothetical protein